MQIIILLKSLHNFAVKNFKTKYDFSYLISVTFKNIFSKKTEGDMKSSILKLIFLLINILQFQYLFSQNCSNTSVGFTPINDLSSGSFRGQQGGLYPAGANVRPNSHNAEGLKLSYQIVPLDTAGNYDPVNGKIVLMSVGMSNTSLEFTQFINLVNQSSIVNPKLVVVNGAQGGKDINKIVNPSDSFWLILGNRLAARGVTAKQVQAIWFKEAEAGPADTTFPGNPLGVKTKYKTVMNILKNNFLNLDLCYFSSRIYAGYSTSLLNPEPFAYYNGWTVKWTIEDQLNGDPGLIYKGTGVNSPWLSWGPYTWADGINPRLDGLTWNCPSDFNSDGTHPSNTGSIKVANRLFSFFSTDETTKPWFLKTLTLNLTLSPEGYYNTSFNSLNIQDTFKIYLRNINSPYSVKDSAVSVIDSVSLKGIYKFYNIVSGSYYIQVNHRNSIETWSKAGGESVLFGSIYNYDFTNSAGNAFGNNQVLKGLKYCFYSGDVNQDGIIDAGDVSNTENDIGLSLSGYIPTDVTGDFSTDAEDLSLIENNVNNNTIMITP